MQCIFKTNPAKNLQDDYLWYCLSGGSWQKGPRSGYAPNAPEAGRVSSEFSSICVGSSYMVLKREHAELSLVVGVPTGRAEVGQHHRPITDTMYLLAENESEESSLCGFAAACFAADDADGLSNPVSEICTAIDEIWKTASLTAFTAKYGRCAAVTVNDWTSGTSCKYPRSDRANRQVVAKQIDAMVRSQRPFLVALTDRSPNEALLAIPDFAGVYYVFSSRVASAERVVRSDFTLTPSAVIEWAGKNRKLVAGVVVAVGLLTLIKACFGPSPKPAVESQLKVANSCTNLPTREQRPCGTNSVNSSTMDATLQKVAGPEIEAGN